MQAKLKIKDLITIGVFAVVYVAVMMLIAVIEVMPVLLLVFPALNALVQGVVVMLFMAKVPKKWALFIFAMIPPILFFAFGNHYVVLIHGLIVATLAELIFRAGGFTSFKHNAVAHAVMSLLVFGSYIQIFVVHDRYLKMTADALGKDYAERMEQLLSYPVFVLLYVSAFAFGLVGAVIGKKMLTKHFEKAGIV